MPKGERASVIEFRLRKPIAEIPKNPGQHPYAKIFKAVTQATKDAPVQPLECKTEEDALRLSQRLTSYFKGSVMVRRPKGSRFVFVAPKGALARRSSAPTKVATRRKKMARKRH